MLYTSQDLLFVVLAFCVLWLTILLSWSLYYMALLLRGAYRMFDDVRQRIEAVDRFIALLTDKLENTSTSLRLLVDGVGSLATFLMERKGRVARAPRRRSRE